MIVTKIEPLGKTRYKVFLEDCQPFVLYTGEVRRFHIAVGEDVREDVLLKIRTEILIKRARLRAMHLLNDMDRTEYQLREKLKLGCYPDDVIDDAIAYVRSFGYIGDDNYARRYISNYKHTKSRKQIYADLCKKGISSNDAKEALSDCYEEDAQRIAIENCLRKKRFDPENATQEERQKIYGYLARKGFSYEAIRQVIQVSDWNA